MIEKKAAGEEIVIQAAEEETAPVPDLMSALKASLDAVRERTGDEDGDDVKPKRKRASSAKSGGPKKAKSAAK
jgi:DNA end-binding protein Ku